MSHLKPGDLALIAFCKVAPEMVGRCVELVARLDPEETYGEFYNFTSHPAWVISADDLLSMDCLGVLSRCDESVIHEKDLLPLRGDFQPEQQKSREVPA